MPIHEVQVKCEPASEEDDSNSQLVANHSSNLVKPPTEEAQPIKLETLTQNDQLVASPSHILHQLQVGNSTLEELAAVSPAGPAATPVCVKIEPRETAGVQHTLETLHSSPTPHAVSSTILDRHMSLLSSGDVPDSSEFVPLMPVKDEPLSEGEQQTQSGDETSDSSLLETPTRGSPKSWTQKDMDNALEALRTHNMSLTKASATYGIPSTTLWQRAHRLGIDTPKKEGSAKSWGEADLRRALHALRAGAISANKASKAYGIPSSTLYKIARREGIRLAAPFNAAPTSWRRADLERALHSIRCGASSVQRAATQFGIPTGTLYGRCKREGIELSRSNPTPWSEDAMGEALEAVRVGQMSINQAAIHFNLPYSSLYGRFKRYKYQTQSPNALSQEPQKQNEIDHQQQNFNQYYHQPVPTHTVHHIPENHTVHEDRAVIQESHLINDRINMHGGRILYADSSTEVMHNNIHEDRLNGEHNMQLYTQHIGHESVYMDQYNHTAHSNQAMYYAQSCNMAS